MTAFASTLSQHLLHNPPTPALWEGSECGVAPAYKLFALELLRPTHNPDA
jgi:hypothetical protein